MTTNNILATGLLVLSFLFAGFSLALERDQIQNWVLTLQDIEQWVQENNITNAEMIDYDNPFDLEGSMANAANRHEEIQDIISSYGFASSDQWANTGSRIIDAYGAVLLDENSEQSYDDVQRELNEQLAILDQDSSLDANQQAMIREQIETIQAVMERMMASSEGDRAAVRSHRDLLDPVFQ